MEKAILEFLSEVVLSEDEKVPALSTTLISTTAEALVTSRVRVESCAVPVAASVGETGDWRGEKVSVNKKTKPKPENKAARRKCLPREIELRKELSSENVLLRRGKRILKNGKRSKNSFVFFRPRRSTKLKDFGPELDESGLDRLVLLFCMTFGILPLCVNLSGVPILKMAPRGCNNRTYLQALPAKRSGTSWCHFFVLRANDMKISKPNCKYIQLLHYHYSTRISV